VVQLKSKKPGRGRGKAGIASAIFCLVASRAIPAQDILPPDNSAPGWKKSGPVRVFIRQDLFNHIDGGAELYLEFGFEKLRVQPYTNGKTEVGLEVYEMSGPASALGIYLMQAGRETSWPEIRARNSSEEAQIAAVKGRYFIRINNFEGAAGGRPVMIRLINNLLANIPEEAVADLFRLLPEEGRIPGTERLVRGPVGLQPYYTFGEGDILGLGGKIFAVLADYKVAEGSTFTRLLIDYRTPAAASAAYAHLLANLDSYLKITEKGDAGFGFVDYQNRRGRVERQESLLDLRFKMKS
jgi:hypothetical protein